MDNANDANGSYPKYMREESVSQNEQHWWHFAIFPIISEMASDNPRCCISTPVIMLINAIHAMTLTQ